jgi:hypothetical protein
MADEIEGVVIPAHFFGQLIQKNALFRKLLKNGLFLFGLSPGGKEAI